MFARLWRRPWLRRMAAKVFFSRIPHSRRLGLRVVDADSVTIEAELPYQQHAVGNPWTGFLHSGAIATLIDQTCGTAASLAVYPPSMVATLDLRLDWVRPATPGLAVRARAECIRITRHILFIQCVAYDKDAGDPVVRAAGTFMRSGSFFGPGRKTLSDRGSGAD